MQAMTDALEQTIGKVILDVGAAANAALVIVGDRLGLYRTLSEIGPATPDELADATSTDARYVREWLAAQAASGYVTYDPMTRCFSMTSEQAMVFADETSPTYLVGGFYSAAAPVVAHQRLAEAFCDGTGIGWGEHHECLFCGTEKFFRPGYESNLVQSWLPSLSGMIERLEYGATVADIGCGHGASTLVMAKAFPSSEFIGYDSHRPSIRRASELAAKMGLANVKFEVADAQDFPDAAGRPYDLVTVFDALHDMGDPIGAARQVRKRLGADGIWMIVEPAAGDRLEDNLTPLGRAFYAMSAGICVPNALSQDGGQSLGAQAGPDALERIVRAGGFSRCRVATETPFNLVLEAQA